MRIIAGAFRGRRLHGPKGDKVRPTIDRVREAIFSMLGPDIPDARVLDLFAGTGAMGLEALSRGAALSVFVDQSADSVRLIRENIELCKAESQSRVIRNRPFPPYAAWHRKMNCSMSYFWTPRTERDSSRRLSNCWRQWPKRMLSLLRNIM